MPGTRGGGSVLKALSAAEGALPRPRCPVKPRIPPNPASARQTRERIRTESGTPRRTAPAKRNLDAENPRRPVANYSTAGVSRTLPCGCILSNGSLGNPYGASIRYLIWFTGAEESPGTYSFHKLLPVEHLLHQTPCSSGTYRPLYLPIAFPT